MLEEHFENFERHGSDMRSHLRGFDHVHRMAKARGEHLCLVIIRAINLEDVAKKNHAVLRDIIEAAEKRADEIGASLGGEKRLRCGENESDVDADAFFGEDAEGADAVGRHGNFRDDIGMPADHLAGFSKHAVVIGGDDFGADGAVFYDVADFDDELTEGLFFFGGEGGVGGDAVDDARGCALADFVEICGIEEELHFFTFVVASTHFRG